LYLEALILKQKLTTPSTFYGFAAEDKDCHGAVENSIVMIDRGMESFVDAVRACQEKKVRAVVVRNVASSGGSENDLVVMGAESKETGVSIPSVFVSRKTGDELDALLTIHNRVFVELFAADDVDSVMAYLSYLIMSVETLFFAMFLSVVLVFICARRVSRQNKCRRCCSSNGERRHALLVNDQSLVEPLRSSTSHSAANGNDIENKPRADRSANTSISLYPVVLVNGAQHQAVAISVPVDPNDEPVFDQQDQ